MQAFAIRLLALAAVLTPLAGFADSSYEHTTQMTGGQFVDMLKNLPMISKQMREMTEPTSTITMVHGNQKAVVSKDYTEITDLDKQVIIHIDNVKKTYTVTTFAQMRKMIAEMPQRMAQMQQQMNAAQAKAAQQPGQAMPPNLQTSFSASVTDPGVTRVIEGFNAKQQFLTLKMTVTDSNNPGTNVAYTMTTEIWTTDTPPQEMKDVQDFDARFGQKLMQGMDTKDLMAQWQSMRNGSNAAMAMMFGGKPGAAEAYAQMQKEMAKIKGTRIIEIQRMGGMGTGIAAPATAPNGAPAANGTSGPAAQGTNGGSVAGQVAKDTATNTAAGESSRLGIPGASLTNAILGAWHRKKSTPQAAPAAAPAQPAPNGTPAANGTSAAGGATAPTGAGTPAGQAPTDVTLMEMTTKTHNFSQEAVPASVFQIPAGYKQITLPTQ